MAETPDRPHRTGVNWLDLIIGLSAVVISCISLWVAQRSDRTQERLLAASVWPYVEFGTSNFQYNRPEIDLSLINAGIGPARIRWIEVRYRGKDVANEDDLLHRCCAPHGAHVPWHWIDSAVTHTVIVQHTTVDFLAVRGRPEIAGPYKLLDASTRHITARVCYCSVLNDCWLLDSSTQDDPKPLGNCPPAPATAYED